MMNHVLARRVCRTARCRRTALPARCRRWRARHGGCIPRPLSGQRWAPRAQIQRCSLARKSSPNRCLASLAGGALAAARRAISGRHQACAAALASALHELALSIFLLEFRDVCGALAHYKRARAIGVAVHQQPGRIALGVRDSKTKSRKHFYSASHKAVCYLLYGLGGLRLLG